MFYFKDAGIPPSKSDPQQLEQVRAFKEKISALGGLYHEFQDAEDFRTEVSAHLTKVVRDWRERAPSTPETAETTRASTAELPLRSTPRPEWWPAAEAWEERQAIQAQEARQVAEAREERQARQAAEAREQQRLERAAQQATREREVRQAAEAREQQRLERAAQQATREREVRPAAEAPGAAEARTSCAAGGPGAGGTAGGPRPGSSRG